MSRDTFLEERFELVKGRIREMQQDMDVPERFFGFFKEMTTFLNYVLTLHEKIREGWLEHAALSELQKNNEELYAGILPGAYESSYTNPAYAVRMLSEDYGRLLSFLAAEVRGIVAYAYEDRLFDMTVLMELYVQIYNLLEEPTVPAQEIKDTLYWYVSDYSEEMVGRRIREAVDPSLDFAVRIICGSDLTDIRYLYKYGEYVTENEISMAEYLNGLSEEEIKAMARTFTEGYRIGFINGRKDISKKNSVNIRYQLGFERDRKSVV